MATPATLRFSLRQQCIKTILYSFNANAEVTKKEDQTAILFKSLRCEMQVRHYQEEQAD